MKVSDGRQSKKAKIVKNQIANRETFPTESHEFNRNLEGPSICMISDASESPEKPNRIKNDPIISTSNVSADSQFGIDSKQSTVRNGIRREVMIIGELA